MSPKREISQKRWPETSRGKTKIGIFIHLCISLNFLKFVLKNKAKPNQNIKLELTCIPLREIELRTLKNI